MNRLKIKKKSSSLKGSKIISKNQIWFQPIDPLKAPVSKLEFIVEGFCARGKITVIGGSAGSGKSLLSQILFQKRDNKLLPTKKGKAIYLTGADSSEDEIRRRAKAINSNNGLFTVSLPENMYCVATNEKFMGELKHQIEKQGFDVVIFDTLADFHDGNLYDPELANNTMKCFTKLARTANVAVILITHTKKGSKVKNKYNVEDISDSRVFGTKADFVFGLKSEYQKDASNLIELQCVKSRSAKHIPPLRAEIIYNEKKRVLKIQKSNRLFAYESEALNQIEKKEALINQVGQMVEKKKPYREIADELDIGLGTVSNYAKIFKQQNS